MDITTLGTLSVTAAAEQRRSIRSFAQEPIPHDDLAEILRVTGLAPSAFNVQPWRFVVVESPEVKAQLGVAAHGQRQVTGAPAVIVLYTDMADALAALDEVIHPGVQGEKRDQTRAYLAGALGGMPEADRERWGAEQGNIALGYLLLAAEAHGYQTSPMLGFDADAVKRVLGLPAHVRIPAMVAIGRGTEEGFPHHRHALDRIARFV